jgi:hypothetical protein
VNEDALTHWGLSRQKQKYPRQNDISKTENNAPTALRVVEDKNY